MGTEPSHESSRKPSPLFPDDIQFWYETLRAFGAAEYGGSSFGEIVATCAHIAAGDYDGWYDAWTATAERLDKEAEAQLSRGRRISARDNFLRASTYYRMSEFFLHAQPQDARLARAYRRTVDCYKACAALFDPAIEPIEISYEGTTLPGYFHRVDRSDRRRPTVIMHTGFDGSAEEMHVMGAVAAVERGYNVVAFDGPGQFGPLHREGLVFRPDWEKVVTPVVDFVSAQPAVDSTRIALMGFSMGGVLASRAAAFEKRLAALFANDGVYDYGAANLAHVPAEHRAEVVQMLHADHVPALDQMLEGMMRSSPTVRWGITHGMYVMGAPTPRAYLVAALDYHLRDGIAEAIACPTLVCAAEGDLFFQGQPEELYAHLTCRKTLMRFTDAEGAGAHCQVGAGPLSFARIYDWLDQTLG